MKHFNLKISGKVQGVFFRVETRKKAQELSLVGFVRNEEDGTVYAEVEGEEALINELITWIKAGGPELASVDDVSVEPIEELSNFEDFSVRT